MPPPGRSEGRSRTTYNNTALKAYDDDDKTFSTVERVQSILRVAVSSEEEQTLEYSGKSLAIHQSPA